MVQPDNKRLVTYAALPAQLDAKTGAPRTIYVSTTGNDTSSGKTWGSAKLTIAGALTALAGSSGDILLGAGTFSTNATHTLPTGTRIVGAGRGATTISYTGTGTLFQGTSGTRTYNQVIMGVVLAGPGVGSTAVAVDLVDVSQVKITDFIISSFGTGVKHRSTIVGGAVYNRFHTGFLTSCGVGVDYSATGSNGSSWHDVKFGSCTIAVNILDSNQNNFHACQFEANPTAVKIDSSVAGLSDNNSFDHCRFESNTTAVNIVSANVRDTAFTWPAIFNAFTYTDNGTRTRWLASASLPPPYTQRSILTRAGGYSMTGGEDIVMFNANAVTATLPSAATAKAGRIYVIKNLHASALTVATAGGTIDGAATVSLVQYAAARYVSDGTNWFAI